jgi:cobalt-zinc-cadmium efflux system outer membrane protein
MFGSKSHSAIALAVLMAAGGCASVPADLGRDEVNAMVADRGQSVESAKAGLVSELIAQPLSADRAVRVALVNNPQLQSAYAQLGFGAADLYEAGRIRNPVFSAALLDPDAAGERDQLTLGLVASFTDLLTLGARKRLSTSAFQALQQAVGSEVLRIAGETRKAWYRYVSASQMAQLRARIAQAGALSAALAQRFREAGNISSRDLAVEQAAASEAQLEFLAAESEAEAARAELANMLGLSLGENWAVADALSQPAETESGLDLSLAGARNRRLDLAAARTRAEMHADRVGVVNWTRWLGDLELGWERERETDGARLSGPVIDWEIPIFNQHQDALLRADAELEMAVAELRQISIEVDNGVRLAHAGVMNARARVTEYRDRLIPQRREVVARAQEEVNFMLIGVFELIRLKQEEYDAYQGYLEAIRDRARWDGSSDARPRAAQRYG